MHGLTATPLDRCASPRLLGATFFRVQAVSIFVEVA